MIIIWQVCITAGFNKKHELNNWIGLKNVTGLIGKTVVWFSLSGCRYSWEHFLPLASTISMAIRHDDYITQYDM